MTQTNLVNRYLSIDKCVRDVGGSRFRGNDKGGCGQEIPASAGIESYRMTNAWGWVKVIPLVNQEWYFG